MTILCWERYTEAIDIDEISKSIVSMCINTKETLQMRCGLCVLGIIAMTSYYRMKEGLGERFEELEVLMRLNRDLKGCEELFLNKIYVLLGLQLVAME